MKKLILHNQKQLKEHWEEYLFKKIHMDITMVF